MMPSKRSRQDMTEKVGVQVKKHALQKTGERDGGTALQKVLLLAPLEHPKQIKPWDTPHQMTGEEPSRELQSCQHAALKSFQTHQAV